MAVLLTPPFLQFLDNNGDPLSGGKVYTYAAGTTTPKATYTDASGATPAANPIILDSAGRTTIWIDGSYKILVTDLYDVPVRSATDLLSSFINSNTTGGTTLVNAVLTTPDIDGGTADNIVIGNSVPNTGAFTTITANSITNSLGISFGNTPSASPTTLDWYQEGFFTPVVAGLSTAGTGTYSVQQGTYTRIGNIVNFSIFISWTAHTGTGSGLITGLPFNNVSGYPAPVLAYNNGYATPASTFLMPTIEQSVSTIYLYAGTVSTGVASHPSLDTAATLYIRGSYTTS